MRLVLLLLPALFNCAGVGDSCTTGTYGDGCAPGLHCSADFGQTGTCVCSGHEALTAGETCVGVDCARCSGETACGAGGICVTNFSTAIGGACWNTAECVMGALCTNEICQPPHSLGEGDRCERDDECAGGLACQYDECARPHDVGGPCASDAWCIPGTICGAPLDPGHCQPLGVVGSLCAADAQCIAGLYCNHFYEPAQCDR